MAFLGTWAHRWLLFSCCHPTPPDPFSAQPSSHCPGAMHGVVVTEAQDPALGPAESHPIGLSLSVSLPRSLSRTIPSPSGGPLSPNSLSPANLLRERKGALGALTHIINRDTEQHGPQYRRPRASPGRTPHPPLPTAPQPGPPPRRAPGAARLALPTAPHGPARPPAQRRPRGRLPLTCEATAASSSSSTRGPAQKGAERPQLRHGPDAILSPASEVTLGGGQRAVPPPRDPLRSGAAPVAPRRPASPPCLPESASARPICRSRPPRRGLQHPPSSPDNGLWRRAGSLSLLWGFGGVLLFRFVLFLNKNREAVFCPLW